MNYWTILEMVGIGLVTVWAVTKMSEERDDVRDRIKTLEDRIKTLEREVQETCNALQEIRNELRTVHAKVSEVKDRLD